MINFEYKDNNLTINSKVVKFNNTIEDVINFDDIIIVMLMDEGVPENNIIAFDEQGNKLWDISKIIILPYAETYVAMSRVNDNSISVISYSGLETYIDIRKQSVISKIIRK